MFLFYLAFVYSCTFPCFARLHIKDDFGKMFSIDVQRTMLPQQHTPTLFQCFLSFPRSRLTSLVVCVRVYFSLSNSSSEKKGEEKDNKKKNYLKLKKNEFNPIYFRNVKEAVGKDVEGSCVQKPTEIRKPPYQTISFFIFVYTFISLRFFSYPERVKRGRCPWLAKGRRVENSLCAQLGRNSKGIKACKK